METTLPNFGPEPSSSVTFPSFLVNVKQLQRGFCAEGSRIRGMGYQTLQGLGFKSSNHVRIFTA